VKKKLIAAAAILGAGVVAVALAFAFDITLGPSDEAEGAGIRVTSSVEDEAVLAQRFAPILRQHSTERFVPIDRGRFVSATVLKYRVGKRTGVLLPAAILSRLPESLKACPVPRCHFFLDIPNVSEHSRVKRYVDVQRRVLGSAAPTVYWHVLRYDDQEDIAVQYWFLYLFNNFENQHEADWEQITIRLDGERKPIEAFYSSHESGQTELWQDTRKIGEHAIVYAAGGSHANYFTPGSHSVILKCRKFAGRKACVRGRVTRDRADGCGRVLAHEESGSSADVMVEERCDASAKGAVVRYELSELDRPAFIGSYAPGNRLVHGLVPAGSVGPTDPQRRAAWNDPLRVLAAGRAN
jgi:hypothetical protein